jgi:hypothetical protein
LSALFLAEGFALAQGIVRKPVKPLPPNPARNATKADVGRRLFNALLFSVNGALSCGLLPRHRPHPRSLPELSRFRWLGLGMALLASLAACTHAPTHTPEIVAPFHYRGEDGIQKYGIVSARGEIVQEPREIMIHAFNADGEAVFYDAKTRKYGVLDSRGNILVPPNFLGYSLALRARGREEKKRSFPNPTPGSDLVIVHSYDSEGNNRYGLNDKDGNRLFPPIFHRLFAWGGVSTGGGVWALPSGGAYFFVFEKDGRKGLINRQGRIVAHPEYDSTGNFITPDFALLKKDQQLFFVDQIGQKTPVPCEDVRAYNFYDYGLAHCYRNKKYGLINARAEYVLPPVFSDVTSFSDHGFAVVHRDGKKGMIDTRGNFVFPVEFDSLSPFNGEMTKWAKKDGIGGEIGLDGAFVFTYGEYCGREVILSSDQRILWPPKTRQQICADARKLPANRAQPGDTLHICAPMPTEGCNRSSLCEAKVVENSADRIQVEFPEACNRYPAGARIWQVKSSVMPPEKRASCERKHCFVP